MSSLGASFAFSKTRFTETHTLTVRSDKFSSRLFALAVGHTLLVARMEWSALRAFADFPDSGFQIFQSKLSDPSFTGIISGTESLSSQFDVNRIEPAVGNTSSVLQIVNVAFFHTF